MCFHGKLVPQAIFLRNSLSLNLSDLSENKRFITCKYKIHMRLEAVEMLSYVLVFYLSR